MRPVFVSGIGLDSGLAEGTRSASSEADLGDAGYRGERFLDEFQRDTGVRLEVVKRSPEQRYFPVGGKRWVVERTFALLGNARRLAKDYELYFKSSAAMVYAAMIRIQLRRLAQLIP